MLLRYEFYFIFHSHSQHLYYVCLKDGAAGIIIFIQQHMDTQNYAFHHVGIHFFFPTTLCPRRRKIIWTKLDSNSHHLLPKFLQWTALSIRPWPLGLLGSGFLAKPNKALLSKIFIICTNIVKQI